MIIATGQQGGAPVSSCVFLVTAFASRVGRKVGFRGSVTGFSWVTLAWRCGPAGAPKRWQEGQTVLRPPGIWFGVRPGSPSLC